MSDPQQQPIRFCSRCGAELGVRTAFGRLRPACSRCGFVVFADPKVACGVLVVENGRVLLVRHRNQPGRGLWCLPCGFADADEPPEAAAAREAAEETGLAVTIERLLGAYHYTDDPRGAGVLLVYVARCAEAQPAAADDADAAGFFEPHDLPELSHHTHARALRDYFGPDRLMIRNSYE